MVSDRWIESNPVVCDHDPDQRRGSVNGHLDDRRAAVVGRVSDRLLHDPVGLDGSSRIQQIERSTPFADPDLDRYSCPIAQRADSGCEADVLEPGGSEPIGQR
ncbi:MAG: hypothetical protein ABIZ71_13140, partial [Gemmatimonadales bacterium]